PLGHARSGVAILHATIRRRVRELLQLATTTVRDGTPASEDPVVRQRLARVYLEAEYLKLLSDRAVSGQLHGRPTGPEGSLAKLVWSDVQNHLAEAAGEVLGPDGLAGQWGRERVGVRSASIAGGTTQGNKNIVGQRVLNRPRGSW